MSGTSPFFSDGACSSALLSAEELMGLLGSNHLKIFDIRGTWKSPPRALYNEYLKGHIPSAIFLDWTRDFLDTTSPLNLASVSDASRAQLSFQKLGIKEDDLIVLYDDYHHMFAGRIWWALKHFGFQNVKVLNGGWKYWTAQSFQTSVDVPTVDIGTYQPEIQNKWRVSLDDFISQKDLALVIDARGPSNYAGQVDDPRSGHIPGVINLPYHLFLDPETGLFLSPEAIQKKFDECLSNWQRRTIISSCGSGYAGTVVMLALMELGIQSSLFDGSFALWKQDHSRAVEQVV